MRKCYFVGSGIASLAGAAYLIRDGGVNGRDIVIFEEAHDLGGALDAHGSARHGYFMSGSRMFEQKYNATFDLFSAIPSLSDPHLTVKEEIDRAATETPWHNCARLIGRDGEIVNSHQMRFSEHDILNMLALMARSEHSLDSKRITDCFQPHFFETNFWFEWCSLFAFERWHSAIEFRRYLLRFMHHFSTIDTQEGIFRTSYNQYDSMVLPLVHWLKKNGVAFNTGFLVTNLGFRKSPHIGTVSCIRCQINGVTDEFALQNEDLVFVTNGSMTAGKTFGCMSSPPIKLDDNRGGAWKLWETLAVDRPEFGDPAAFTGHIDESCWISFTVTVSDPLFFDRMRQFSHSEAGEGGLITFKDSPWLLTLSIFKQPFYASQPANVFVWWGYGLYIDKPGTFVPKTLSECSGKEILEEVLGHLRFNADRDRLLSSSICIPCRMPYITSQFLVRKRGDRPDVVPPGSTNLAFIGQFSELPDDVVFTVEYSIRSAEIAVYSLLKLEKKPAPFYKGQHDPRVLIQTLETLNR